MEFLLDSMLPKHQDKEILWLYSEKPDLYCKYTQYVAQVPNKEEVVEEHVNEVAVKEVAAKEVAAKEVAAKEVAKTIVQEPQNTTCKKSKKQTPKDIIIQLTENIPENYDYMKDKLIAFISNKSFQKFFGVKKTAEVMQGITNNKWNKSLVLFMSFLFDTSFVYLKKEVVYNAAVSKRNITI